ncbi:hypothetical protein BCR37DRAFT_193278 [Protomyces lactucae-debilis]|uniref:RecQ-mediated genome instability protein 1 n=1 Tax=Protomyces lactucae-debilis TaxID=2754530 RepID=A0A1Y2EU87_PROLT|nr:uncharacterized protein BCR37DRAFT_193278 [Protomyces lactucae-debilis]ORY75099.1 hypothetical protein BCR37DRAFT_193278 [Protomyces lactucae-debilis]
MQTQAQVAAYLAERHIHTSSTWLQTAYAHAGTLHSIEPLTHTITKLLLQTDITASLGPDAPSFPPLPDEPAGSGFVALRAPTVVQIMAIAEIGTSLAGQLDAVDALREKQKPIERRLVRLNEEPVDADGAQPAATAPMASHGDPLNLPKKTLRLVLQDARGQRRFAIEQKPVAALNLLQTPVGSKLLLDAGVLVVQGVVLLKTLTTVFLGGGLPGPDTQSALTRLDALEADLKARRDVLPRAEGPVAQRATQQDAQAVRGAARAATRGRARGRGGRGRS